MQAHLGPTRSARRTMVYVARTGSLYRSLGEEAVNELTDWLNQVYDAKQEMERLRRDVREILGRLHEIQMALIRQ